MNSTAVKVIRHFVIICIPAYPHLKPLTVREIVPMEQAHPVPSPKNKPYEVLREEPFSDTCLVAHLMAARGDLLVEGFTNTRYRILPKKFPGKVIHRTKSPVKREVYVSFAV